MVVIIAAVPGTLRIGRSMVRSTRTPRMPQNSMTPMSASSSTPTSGNPVRMTRWPTSPVSFSTHMAKNDPTMKMLKCAKLMSSMMP